MTSDDRPSQRAAAGRWLREQRQRHGFATAAEFARAIGTTKEVVSNYEVGRSSVPDDRSEKIAEVLGMDVIELRRNLGLWIPPADRGKSEQPGEVTATALADRLRRDANFRRRVFDELVSGSGQGTEVNQSDTEGDSDSSVA